MSLVSESKHPLVRQQIAKLRSVQTTPPEFRILVRNLSVLLGAEATTDLPTRPITVQTPMAQADGYELDGTVAIVPILRAGLGMAEGFMDLIPEAQVWHIGLFRDETTLKPTEYYNKLSERCEAKVAIVVDPMLATGGSAIRTCEILTEIGVSIIKVVSLIGAPEGIKRLTDAFPTIPIHLGAIDRGLTEIGFITPGLGDAGDRQFGTAF